MTALRFPVMVAACCTASVFTGIAQEPSTFEQVRQSMSSCIYEVSLRPALEGESSFSFRDTEGTKFVQTASTLTNIVAGALQVSGPRIVTEGEVPSQLYSVRMCDESGVANALRTALGRGLKLEIVEARRSLQAYVLRIAAEGTREGLAEAEAGESRSVRLMRDTLQLRATPIEGLIGILENLLGAPVIDDSGLAGAYSFDLQFDRSDPASVRAAIAENLGLALEMDSRELPVIVIQPLSGSARAGVDVPGATARPVS